MSFFPIVELVDRLVIARLKHKKTNGANQSELEWYEQQFKNYDLSKIELLINQLYDTHKNIWNLEKELKSGNENRLTLAEIGKRAIEIRNLNNIRIRIRNSIADKLDCNIREIKIDHISE